MMGESNTPEHRLRKLGKGALIIICWLAIWHLLSLAIGNAWLLSGPVETAEAWLSLAATSAFWIAVLNSLGRIALGFGVAFLVGMALGYAAAKHTLLRDFIRPAIQVIKAAPVVCIIALLLVGTGANAATSIVVGLVVFPQFYHGIIEALSQRDEELDEVLRTFGITNRRKALYVELVSIGSSLRAACAVAAGLAWKSGIAAELIGLPAMSIGTGVYLAKISLDSATIIAWTATVILLSWLSEKLLLAAVDLLLRLPKHELSRRVKRALSGIDWEIDESDETSVPCGIIIDGLECSFPASTKNGERHATLIYKRIEATPGERLCVMAPSGSGKTTLLRLIAGIIVPDQGRISFSADDQGQPKDIAHPSMSVMLQECTLLPWATALENVALIARDDAEIRRAHDCLLQVLDAEDLSKPIATFSGGMKRRAELCRALAHQGSLILADEPFSGIDDEAKKRCIALIDQGLCGRTLIIATHNEEDAKLLGARSIRL